MRRVSAAAAAVMLAAVIGPWTAGSAGAETLPLPVTFTQPTVYPGGSSLYEQSAAADFDGDGHTDLAVADANGGAVSVFLGHGDGTFAAPVAYATGSEADAVAIGDLNGDGDLDLVVARTVATGQVAVLLGNGDGTFGTAAEFAAGGFPEAVALGDVNGDGDLDVAVGDGDDPGGGMSILLGAGDGSFDAPVSYAAGTGGFPAVALADLNGDGSLDLIGPNQDASNLTVLFNAGDGSFGSLTTYPTGSSPSALAVADLDGDGLLDVAVASFSDTVSVRLGVGLGAFGSATDYAFSGEPFSVAAADFNNDGRPDLVVTVGDDDVVSVRLGAGGGAFGTATDFATPGEPIFALPADLNGDNAVDLAVTNINPASVSVTLNTTGTATVPGTPTISRTAEAGGGQATLSWTTPASDGASALRGYVITPYVGYWPIAPSTFDSTATTETVTGLTPGTTYHFRVQAFNGVGTGDYSKVTNPVTPTLTAPYAPTIEGAAGGSHSAVVEWDAPAGDGGSPITGYVVTPYNGYWPGPPVSFPSTATIETITGLQSGVTYRFRVQAVNAVGAGAYSRVTIPVTTE